MADEARRTARERAAARREREAARAARVAARRSPGDDELATAADDEFAPGAGDARAPGADDARAPGADHQRATGADADATAGGRSDEPLVSSRGDHPAADAAAETAVGDSVPEAPDQPRRGDRSVENGDGPSRHAPPIKSFPSPPDPDFYLPEDQLETPSGTKRVSRMGDRQRAVPPRPARRRRPITPRQRTAPTRRRPWLVRIMSLIALLAAAALAWFLIELFQPFGVSPHGRVKVTIPPSSSSSQVAAVLARDGVISSSFFFELRATLAGDRGKLRSGNYRLQQGMSYGSVLQKLTAVPPRVPTTNLTIADGHSRSQVAALLEQQGIKGSYVALTRHSKLLDPQRYGAPRSTPDLEGFLFPDTFTLRTPVRLATLVAAQLTDFKRRFGQLSPSAAEHQQHLTPYQLLIVASLIEGEAATQSDRDKVASVIYNRLRDHMPLQLDATTRYATGNYTGALTTVQLNSSSPYNTRNHAGLPPTPINSPGLSALQAAAHPAATHDLYFFAKHCSDQTVFFTDYTQFQNAVNADAATACHK